MGFGYNLYYRFVFNGAIAEFRKGTPVTFQVNCFLFSRVRCYG